MPTPVQPEFIQNTEVPPRPLESLTLGVRDAMEQELLEYDRKLLEHLLSDRSSPAPSKSGKYRNVRWCTDVYEKGREGKGFSPADPITLDRVTGKFQTLIRPRVSKSAAEQRKRSRDNAEVFTPSWVCNAQNNLVDAAWFDREGVFNTEAGQTWTPTTGRIVDFGARAWQDYVLAVRMEVACGEAPYLASRYDTVSGETLPVPRRIGLLDRKLRIVSENVADPAEWRAWALKAVQSVYGFDYQGDNVLLARENLLFTVLETYHHAFQRLDWTREEVRFLGYVISWNIWQMDGLTGTIPAVEKAAPAAPSSSLSIPEDLTLTNAAAPEKENPSLAQIRDWTRGKYSAPIAFNDLFKQSER